MLTQQQIKTLFELRKKGKSIIVIAGLIGVNKSTVSRHLHKGCLCPGLKFHLKKCVEIDVK